jgi:hypothetical protein
MRRRSANLWKWRENPELRGFADDQVQPGLFGITAHHLTFNMRANLNREFFMDDVADHPRSGGQDHPGRTDFAVDRAVDVGDLGVDVPLNMGIPTDGYLGTAYIAMDCALDLNGPFAVEFT